MKGRRINAKQICLFACSLAYDATIMGFDFENNGRMEKQIKQIPFDAWQRKSK